ncbi:fucosyltransferase 1, partial [Mus musculus]
MWTPSRRQLCLTFLLVCVLSAGSFFFHLNGGNFFRKGLTLSVLCSDYHLRSPQGH